MKRFAVVVSGAPESERLKEVSVGPGTTVRDLLTELGIPDYLLGREGSGEYFAATDELFGLVDEGAKLRAVTPAKVGGR